MSERVTHTAVTVEARAKVNVFLRVLGRRPDGYHELETLVVPIGLADRLQVRAESNPASFDRVSLSLEVTGEPHFVRGVPADESNLVLRAAAALAERAGVRGFADIRLEKRVPSAGGLGGGSADAAATLKVLNELWGCGLDDQALRTIGAAVGSDVPALLAGRACVARGRGEIVVPVEIGAFRWAIVPAPFGVSTAEAYRWWDEDGGRTGPEPDQVIEAARAGDVEALGRAMFNDLEGPVLRRHSELQETKDRLLAAGAAGVVLSGSGPTMAALLYPGRDFASDGALESMSGSPE